MSHLPAPPISAEVDLTDFPFMPLDVRRLRDSDLASLETPEACWAAVLLWAASWHQLPAGSLPDDDRVLSQLAGFGRVVKEWLRIRDGALRGFVKCSDGRLYHPVVVEKAIEAWDRKLRARWKRDLERVKKHHQRHKTEATYPTFEEWKLHRAETGSEQWPTVPIMSRGTVKECPLGQTQDVPRDSGAMSQPCPPENTVDSGQGQGQGQVNLKPISEQAAAAAEPSEGNGQPEKPPPPPSSADAERAKALSARLDKLETARSGIKARRTSPQHPDVVKWVRTGVTDPEFREAYDRAVLRRQQAFDPAPINPGFLLAFIQEVVRESKGGSVEPTVVRAWHESASGIEAKGKELGIAPPKAETGGFPAFKARVFKAAGMGAGA